MLVKSNNLITYCPILVYCAGVQDYEWGWRFSLGFACVFASLFFLGTVISPDSPNSLLLNGKTETATLVSP